MVHYNKGGTKMVYYNKGDTVLPRQGCVRLLVKQSSFGNTLIYLFTCWLFHSNLTWPPHLHFKGQLPSSCLKGGGKGGGRGAKKAAMPGTMPLPHILVNPCEEQHRRKQHPTTTPAGENHGAARTHAAALVLMTADGGGGGGGAGGREEPKPKPPHYQPSARPAARPRPPSPAPRALLSSRAMKSGCAASRASTWSSIQRADRRPLSSRAICFTPFNSLAPLHGQRVPGSGRRSIQR